MFANYRQYRIGRTFLILIVTAAWVPGGFAQTPSSHPAEGRGEVIGDDVYVRSGASANHYPVCKLNAGARITVVGETGEWLEILPPDSVFSYVSGDYVDSPDGRLGVVNGDNVRVRAGTALTDFQKLKYVVQGHLSKGAEVSILGREADGFLRITPPPGVTVWINRQFVEMIPEALLNAEREASALLPKSDESKTAPKSEVAKADAAPTHKPKQVEAVPGALATLPQTEQRKRLEGLDVKASAELAKPVLERHFAPLIAAYRKIATEGGEVFASQYANARVAQLTKMAELVDTVRKMRRLSEAASSERRKYLEARAKITETMPPIPSGVDAQGEIRVSALYPEGSLPRRYRLVNTTDGRERTIAYVEIPRDSGIKIDKFIGQFVGVRAAAKRLQTGGVNPVPIYVLGDLVRLNPDADESGSAQQK